MSRNQPGARSPQWRHPADRDAYGDASTGQAAPQWGRYPEPAHQAFTPPQPTAQGYYFPKGGEHDPNYGYAQQAGGGQPAGFERFPPPAGPGFAPASQAHAPAAHWNQQHDPSAYDLGGYMPAAQHAPSDAHGEFGAHHAGYGESDADYDEAFGEDDEEPRRGRRGLVIIGALVGAIGLGGALAYTYKAFIAPAPGRAPLVKALDPSGNKIKPIAPGGKEFAHSDKKLLNRLGEEGAARSDTQEDRASDDPNAPRKVRIIPIAPGNSGGGVGTAQAGPAPPVSPLAGITLDTPGQPGPSAQRAQNQPGPPVKPVQAAPSPPPVKIASAGPAPIPSASEPPPPARKGAAVSAAPPIKAAMATPPKNPVPKAKEKASATVATTSASGFVAVLSSQKSRMDALKAFADLQQKYGDVLAAKTPDVQEANLGDKGVWYRAVVGPPGSRDAASGVCTQLKTAGYSGCWVTTY